MKKNLRIVRHAKVAYKKMVRQSKRIFVKQRDRRHCRYLIYTGGRFNFGYCELKHKTLLPTECPCRNWKAAAAGH